MLLLFFFFFFYYSIDLTRRDLAVSLNSPLYLLKFFYYKYILEGHSVTVIIVYI